MTTENNVEPSEKNQSSETIQISELGNQFILHWGEMGTRWGINRTAVSYTHLDVYKRQAVTYLSHGF